MEAPHNKPEPSMYFNCDIQDKSVNRPIVFFVRKPGMIVSYEDVSAWTAGIPSTNKNEFVFGIFVLNSLNRFKVDDRPVESLEEYVRKSELADHTSWNDWSDSHFNPRVISKIQKSVTKVISGQYAEDDIAHKPKENSELSRYLGDLILPPDGFGSGANNDPRPPKPGPSQKTKKKFSFSIDVSKITYRGDKMTVPMELKTSANKKITHTAFEIQIDSESGKIKMTEWEKGLKLVAPFSIEEIGIYLDSVDGEKTNAFLKVTRETTSTSFEDISFTLRSTGKGAVYGLDITSAAEHSLKIHFTTVIQLTKKNVRPAFIFEKEAK